ASRGEGGGRLCPSAREALVGRKRNPSLWYPRASPNRAATPTARPPRRGPADAARTSTARMRAGTAGAAAFHLDNLESRSVPSRPLDESILRTSLRFFDARGSFSP